MKRTRYALPILAALAALATASGCAPALADQPADDAPRGYEFRDISDYFAERVPSGAVRVVEEQAEKAAEAEQEAAEAAAQAEAEHEYQEVYYEPYSGPQQSWDSADGFYSQGVRQGVDSETETYYSSNVARHHRTGEWHTDDEGYWRDADGYYIVSSDDYAPESVVNTSKGEGKVYDGGTASGNFDLYVSW